MRIQLDREIERSNRYKHTNRFSDRKNNVALCPSLCVKRNRIAVHMPSRLDKRLKHHAKTIQFPTAVGNGFSAFRANHLCNFF